MKWQVIILPAARKLLAAISDRRIRESIERRIERLEHDPEKQGKPLDEDLAGYRSVRVVGQRYRIVYKLEAERVVVLVVTVGIGKAGDKKDVYEVAKKVVNFDLLDLDTE